MNESWHTRLRRWGFNFFPAYHVYPIDLVDRDGVVHASVEKTIYI